MRALLAGERATVQAARVAHWFKLEVQNGSGTWKDLGALLGDDYVIGGSVQEDIDQPVSAASFRIRRAAATHSLSPLVLASALNVDDTGAYAPLLDVGRPIRLNAATVAPGVTPTTEWREIFTGRIDDVTWESDPIVIHCSDLGAWLMDTQIELDGVQYGTTPVGTALETVIQNILNAWPSGKGIPTLYTPASPGFAVTNWLQGRTKVLEAVRAIALNSTGWDVRYRYDASHVSRLTLLDPQRARTSIDTTIGPTEYTDVRKLAITIADLRNVGRLSYVDSSGATLSVQSPLIAAQPTDPSVVKYGRRYFEFPTSDSIKTSTQAQALINAVVSDLNGAPADQEIVMPFAWFIQLYDRDTFTQNGDHYDQDQTLAVVSYRHDFDGGSATTSVQCAGKVIGAYADLLRGITTFANLAPSLDVVATPGPTSYSIAYTSPTTVQLSINGGAYAAAPASPITVTRPSAGSTPLSYSFRAIVDDQTVVDSIDVQPVGGLDTDTVTPDLVVTPTTVTATTQDYTTTATNPKAGGAAPTITVTIHGATGLNVTTSAAIAADTPTTVASGDTIRANRPAFATVAGASITFRASISGGGAETIGRTVLTQVKSVFGPSLDVVPTPGTTSYSIAYAAAGGTVELSISGGTYTTAPASPISVTRPAAGGTPLEYAFRIVADGQTITDSVTVQPVDKDTVTADLSVVPSNPLATTQDFTPTVSNPSGGTAPSLSLTLVGTGATNITAGGTWPAGGPYSIPSGTLVRVDRPAFGTVAQAAVSFTASIAGGGSETIQRSIPTQVKTSFGPSLTVTPTVSSGSVSIAYTATGTVELSIDGGAYAAAPASPISVTRNTADHTYAFRATLDGQVVSAVAAVPALSASGVTAPSITGILAYNAVYPGDGGGSFDLSWLSNNLPSGVTYDVAYKITAGNTSGSASGTVTGATGSPITISHPLGSAAPWVELTITAKLDGTPICTGVFGNAAIAI